MRPRLSIGTMLTVALLVVPNSAGAPAVAPHDLLTVAGFDRPDDGGLSWLLIADDQLGGGTAARLSRVSPGAGGSAGALRLEARLGDAPPTFAGVWGPIDPQGELSDLGGYRAVRFWARGDGGSFRVGVRAGVGAATGNFVAPFVAAAEWTRITVPLDDLVAQRPGGDGDWDRESVGWIGFTTGPGAAGDAVLEVDEVELVPAIPVSRSRRARPQAPPVGGEWRTLAEDAAGDGGGGRLPDARALAYLYDREGDRLWFRFDLEAPLSGDWLGVNLAVDTDLDPGNGMAWWGTNGGFHFDRLVTVWLSRAAAGDYQGVVGVADAAGAGEMWPTNVLAGGVDFSFGDGNRRIYVGVPRTALDDDLEMNVLGVVGSAFVPSDELPDGTTGAPLRASL